MSQGGIWKVRRDLAWKAEERQLIGVEWVKHI